MVLGANALRFLCGQGLPLLLGLVLRLHTHDTTAPPLSDILVTVCEVRLAAFYELGKFRLIFRSYSSEGNGRYDLLVNNSAKTSAALDDTVGHIHLTAKRWEPDDELDRGDIVRNDNEASLFLLYQLGNMVDTVLQANGLLRGSGIAARFLRLSHESKTPLLLNVTLRLVLGHELEESAGGGGIHRKAELIDCRRNLQTNEKDFALPLQTNVLWPLDIATKINALRKNVLADTKVLRTLLEKRVDNLLLDGFLHSQRRWGRCASFTCFRFPLRSVTFDSKRLAC